MRGKIRLDRGAKTACRQDRRRRSSSGIFTPTPPLKRRCGKSRFGLAGLALHVLLLIPVNRNLVSRSGRWRDAVSVAVTTLWIAALPLGALTWCGTTDSEPLEWLWSRVGGSSWAASPGLWVPPWMALVLTALLVIAGFSFFLRLRLRAPVLYSETEGPDSAQSQKNSTS